MEQILITRANTAVELINSSATITSIISAEHRKAALGEDVVVMTVESAVDRAFGIGDSIKLFGGNTYKINQIPSVEKISERQFRYNLVFEGIQYDLLRVLYRNEDVSSFSTSSEFALTGDIEMFLNVLINNANRAFGANKWALGEFPANTETKNLLFSNENCLTVLQRICAEYSYEFTFSETSTQKILNVKRVGSELDFTFEYGKGKGLYNLKRDSVDSKKIINKLFVYGSTKNIPANYKNYSQRLHFGTVSPFTESVITDEDSIASFGVCEGSIIFDDVFPTGYNSITTINTSNRLEFIDSSMSFDLNAKDGSGNTLYLIPGVTAKVHFNSGNLAGYEFEVEKYTHSVKKFTLKPVTDEKGLSFPSLTESAFQLSVGDNYSLIDIVMPQSLIDAAESLLQSKGVDYLNENKAPIVKYSVVIDEAYLKSQTSELNIFDVGDSVVIKDSDFSINTRIKIISFSRDVLNPYRYAIVVSDVPEIGALRALAVKTNEADRIIRHNGLNDPIKFKQDPSSNVQIQSQIDETINRKPSVVIGRESTVMTLGNKENDTLVEVLGRFGLADNVFYDKSFTNDDGSVLPMLGLDTYELFLHGDLELGGKLLLQSGVVEIGTRDYDDNLQAAYLSSPNNRLILESSQGIETAGDFFVSKIAGIGSAAVLADSNWQFLQPVLGVDSANAASFVTRYYVDTIFAASAFGDIRIYPAVKAASNGTNITLSGLQTIDGVSLSVDEKVLLKDQTSPAENYIWIVKSGAWERVSDLPNNSIKGVQVQVTGGGLVNKGGIFVNTNSEDEEDIILGTTAISFVQSFQNIGNPYMASLAANDQIFYGTNKFIEKLEVRTPLSNTEAANKAYVDLQDNALANTMTTGFWGKISNFGIGTTTNNGLNFYSNNVKRAELSTGGRLTGLAGININDTVFTPAFATSGFGSYYGLTSNKGVYVGSLGGTTQNLYSADFVRGGNSGARAGLRFGSYNSGGGIANFYYGIEYSTAEKLTIGRYSSSGMDGNSTAFDSSKLIVFDSSGNTSFGKSVAEYRVDVNGDINVSGMFRINGSFGADHTFLKSNGTTQEFAEINCGEISDIADLYLSIEDAEDTYLSITEAEENYALKQDAVLYATFDNERGIPFYSDVEKTTLEAQISVNADAGIALGIYGYKFINEDTNNPVQFGLQLNRQDGKLYHYTLEGTQERILTTADDLGGGGSDWNGGIVSMPITLTPFSGLNLQYQGYPSLASITTHQFSNITDPYLRIKSQKGIGIEATTELNLSGSEVAINDVVWDTSNVASLVGQNAKFAITQIDFGRYKATLIAA